MDEPSDLTELEAEIRAALRAQRLAPGPDCLTPEVLLELADSPLPAPVEARFGFRLVSLPVLRKWFAPRADPNKKRERAHLASCAYCRRELLEWKADLFEADQRNRDRAGSERLPQSAVLPALTLARGEMSEFAAVSALPLRRSARRSWALRGAIGVSLAAAVLLLFSVLRGNKTVPAPETRIVRAAPPLKQQVLPSTPKKESMLSPAELARQDAPKSTRRPGARSGSAAPQQAASHSLAAPVKTRLTAAQRSAAALGDWMTKAQPQFKMAWKDARESGGDVGGGEEKKPEIALRAPAGLLLETRPTLLWQAAPDAEEYKVTIHRNDADYSEIKNVVGKVEPLPGGMVRANLTKALTPGCWYFYQVAAYRGEALSGHSTARFFVVKAPPPPRAITMPQHLAWGDAYLHRDLLEEAEREYRAIPPGNPLYATAQQRLNDRVEKRRVQLIEQK